MSLPTAYQDFIHLSRYARWLPAESRRESIGETVGRYFDFFQEHLEEHYGVTPKRYKTEFRNICEPAVLDLQVMPSMRALMTAGPALQRESVCGYNCSYVPINHVRAFDEILYILMNGTGVGFSVEAHNVAQLPTIPPELVRTSKQVVVGDSKAGWAKALRELIASLYSGNIPTFDVSEVRPAGARLVTFGGRASGPGPLLECFEYFITMFSNARGRKLTSLQVHDLVCKIAEIVVVGGVRRSALISLSDLNDDHMRKAKSGQWWDNEKQRALANNSAVYNGRPDVGVFMSEWLSLYDSKSGERGIFNRAASREKAAQYRRQDTHEYGTNPCSEIILRPNQFCNLSEIVVRSHDSFNLLRDKAYIATVLGTMQSTLTNFKYLRSSWKNVTEEERLLGVSMTGIMDNDRLSNICDETRRMLRELRDCVRISNLELAESLDIQPSAATTCVKPSGTVSQLVDSASGIHTRHSDYYIRTVRGDVKDPLTNFLKDAGVPWEPDCRSPDNTVVFSFPIRSPAGAATRNDLTAIEHLELWSMYNDEWCEHKPSITVSVRESEWPSVGAWVWENFDTVSGVSFLPHSDHAYVQAPYQEVTEPELYELEKKMPKEINWAKLADYEKTDTTASSQTLACTGSVCEIVDIGSN